MKCQHSFVHPADEPALASWRTAAPKKGKKDLRGPEPRARLVVVAEHDCLCGRGVADVADCCEPFREAVRAAAADKKAWIRKHPKAKVV